MPMKFEKLRLYIDTLMTQLSFVLVADKNISKCVLHISKKKCKREKILNTFNKWFLYQLYFKNRFVRIEAKRLNRTKSASMFHDPGKRS